MLVNDAVLAEYNEVLLRPKFAFPPQLIQGFMSYISHKASHCFSIPQPERTPDPGDQMFWDLALTNNAYLVTGNTRHYLQSEMVMTATRFLDLVRNSA